MVNKPTLIIAEAGVNHNGNMDTAFKLVDSARACKADMVKFQSFNAKKLTTRTAKKAEYQELATGAHESQQDMLKKLEMSRPQQLELANYAKQKGIEFLSSPFDNESAMWLINELNLKTIKVGSGELTNGPMLLKIAQTNTPMIISTGMANLSDIEQALAVIAYGYLENNKMPRGFNELWDVYNTPQAYEALKSKVTILHCTTEYPAPFNEIHLKSMNPLKNVFGIEVGVSDHTEGIAVPIAAVALGATVIEKHFTLDKNMVGPDHKASLNPSELRAMVESIRQVEVALGQSRKAPSPTESKNKLIARKSLVSLRDIPSGAAFTSENLTCKRPGTGISPMEYWDYLGKTAQRNYQEDELI